MKFITHLRYHGITLRRDGAGGILMTPTDPTMPPATVADFIKRHRDDILLEMDADALPGLPTACPISDGGFAPDCCRFSTPVLMSLIIDGVLPDPVKGCPFRELCGLWSLWPSERSKDPLPAAFDPDPPTDPAPPAESTPGDCDQCPAAATWDYGRYASQGMLCFHYAYYQQRPGKPKPCAEMAPKCPRGADGSHS